MTRRPPAPAAALALLIAAALSLSACSERPFVDAYPAELSRMLPAEIEFDVCYPGGADPAEIQRLADETCADRQMRAEAVHHNRWQCRMTAPHSTRFRCR